MFRHEKSLLAGSHYQIWMSFILAGIETNDGDSLEKVVYSVSGAVMLSCNPVHPLRMTKIT